MKTILILAVAVALPASAQTCGYQAKPMQPFGLACSGEPQAKCVCDQRGKCGWQWECAAEAKPKPQFKTPSEIRSERLAPPKPDNTLQKVVRVIAGPDDQQPPAASVKPDKPAESPEYTARERYVRGESLFERGLFLDAAAEFMEALWLDQGNTIVMGKLRESIAEARKAPKAP